MSRYFDKFLNITYDGEVIKDITKRNNFIQRNLSDPYLFLPYTVREGERPEDVALNYYGSVDYTWLVLLANDILDPYNEWPLNEEEFHKYLMKKYEQESGQKGYAVIAWTQNQDLADNIVYYYKPIEEETVIYTGDVVENSNTAPTVVDYDDVVVTINGIRYQLNKL